MKRINKEKKQQHEEADEVSLHMLNMKGALSGSFSYYQSLLPVGSDIIEQWKDGWHTHGQTLSCIVSLYFFMQGT